MVDLKGELLRLLKEDEEFRYAVMGLLGIEEILKAIKSLQEQVAKHSEAILALQRTIEAQQDAIISLQKKRRIAAEGCRIATEDR
ncbi:MAG: hypothetical protein TU35_007595 [Thermoproteus sp. AZ2]|uniref:Uncharacterized protein n=1 Tax=Thermoproteus sp. AZ2 TaxID=1609232 RepID=A0ACC6V264_9CREN